MKHQLTYSKEGEVALRSLEDQGIIVPLSTESDLPKLPSDITQLDSEDLMELFTSLTSFLDFVSYQVALAEISEKTIERRLDIAIAKAMVLQPKGLASVVKAAAMADAAVVALSEEHAVAYNYCKLIQVMAENLNRDIVLVSRELTRRTSDGSSMTRARKFAT